MTAAPAFDHYQPALHTKNNNLKAWWRQFTSAQRTKKETEEKRGVYSQRSPSSMFPYLSAGLRPPPPRPLPTGQSVVFGKPLKESLKYASVQISTANGNGELYVWGYIPVVVAKSCVPFTLRSAIVPANANQTT